MKQWSGLDLLQIIGALTSILGAYLTITQGVSTANILFIALIIVGLLFVLVSSSLSRRGRLPKVGRDAMISTGRRLIEGTKREVVLFGSDMSWAPDYEDAIRSITSSGKKATVIFPSNPAPKVTRNAKILKEAGAELIATSIDSGIRAILVDPNDSSDALLFVANRTLKEGALSVEIGDRGKSTDYIYVAKVYDIKHDWPLVRAVISLYQVLHKPG